MRRVSKPRSGVLGEDMQRGMVMAIEISAMKESTNDEAMEGESQILSLLLKLNVLSLKL